MKSVVSICSLQLSKILQRLLLLLTITAVAAVAQIREPDVRLTGALTGNDNQSYKMLSFAVPVGVARITVDFTYTGKDEHTALDLGIYDPVRFRGWSGGNKSHFTIGENDATQSYMPGAILPGQWNLIVGIPNIRPQSRSEYEAKIYFARTPQQRVADSAFSTPRGGPGWYRGDLHLHTGSSDGSCTSKVGNKTPCPLFKTLEMASERKLDFVALTDHNDVSHFQQLRELAPYYDNLTLLHGREITTFQGHANLYGTDAPIDFRVGSPDVPDMNTLLRQVRDAGGLISINHPNAPTGEECMGCGWKPAPETDLALVQAVEAVNSADSGTPYEGAKYWTEILNRGMRLTGIGGSDNHDASSAESERGAIGHPTTVVYADKLSEREILAAIRAGHVFIDLEGTADQMLELNASSGAVTARMGDNLNLPANSKVQFSLRVGRAKNNVIEVVRDGVRLERVTPPLVVSDDETRTFELVSDGQRHWVRVTVRDPKGKALLIGNPIYLNFCCSQSAQGSDQGWLPAQRVLMDAHNCYPYDGHWPDRIQQALSSGFPLAIEQDLALYSDPGSQEPRVVVTHNPKGDGAEPTLESYFFETIRPQIEHALKRSDRANWPLITLNLDFKDDSPALIRAVRSMLAKYRGWLTTAKRGSTINEVKPLHVGPVLVLTGESDTQQTIFFDEVPAGEDVLAFGAAHPAVQDPTASPEALLTEPVNNYRRWANAPWQVVEPAGQRKAGEWTEAKQQRLRALVARAHQLGYWMRFYTLDGGSAEQFKQMGWFEGYNFGSLEAARKRWIAAREAGVDFIASDHYVEVANLVSHTDEHAGETVPAKAP